MLVVYFMTSWLLPLTEPLQPTQTLIIWKQKPMNKVRKLLEAFEMLLSKGPDCQYG